MFTPKLEVEEITNGFLLKAPSKFNDAIYVKDVEALKRFVELYFNETFRVGTSREEFVAELHKQKALEATN